MGGEKKELLFGNLLVFVLVSILLVLGNYFIKSNEIEEYVEDNMETIENMGEDFVDLLEGYEYEEINEVELTKNLEIIVSKYDTVSNINAITGEVIDAKDNYIIMEVDEELERYEVNTIPATITLNKNKSDKDILFLISIKHFESDSTFKIGIVAFNEKGFPME